MSGSLTIRCTVRPRSGSTEARRSAGGALYGGATDAATGLARGDARKAVQTTRPDPVATCLQDHVNR